MPKEMTFDFYEDPSQGYLMVPLSMLTLLGIEKDIGRRSYMWRGWAYLEKSRDMGIFLEMAGPHITKIKIRKYYTDHESEIRRYEPYTEGWTNE